MTMKAMEYGMWTKIKCDFRKKINTENIKGTQGTQVARTLACLFRHITREVARTTPFNILKNIKGLRAPLCSSLCASLTKVIGGIK